VEYVDEIKLKTRKRKLMTTWPFMSTEFHLGQHRIPQKNQIMICYFPGCGVQFLSSILSCSESLFGKTHFDFLENKYKTKNIDTEWQNILRNNFNPIFNCVQGRYFTFNDWLSFDRIIYINYEPKNKVETDWLLFRRNFVDAPSMRNDTIMDVTIRYDKELYSFLKRNNKEFYEFPHLSIATGKNFEFEINKCLKYFGFTEIDNTISKKLWKTWFNLNLNKGKIAPHIPYHVDNGTYDVV
jgi:hypothetical protein